MYRAQPYARPYDPRHHSNISYLRTEPVRSPSTEMNPPLSNNPFQLRSRAVFGEHDYYDSENTSESSRSPSRSSSSRSTPASTTDEYYPYSTPSTPDHHYINTPFSYDPRRSHEPLPESRQYAPEVRHYQTPSHSHEAHAHLQLPPLVPPQVQVGYYPGPTLPPLQLPVTASVQPTEPTDPSSIIEAYIQRPFCELGEKSKKKATCTWPKVSAYGHEPAACGYTARSDMVVRHIRAVHFKIK